MSGRPPLGIMAFSPISLQTRRDRQKPPRLAGALLMGE